MLPSKGGKKAPKRLLRHLNEVEEDALFWSRQLMSGGSGSMGIPPKALKAPKRLRHLNEFKDDRHLKQID
jgi:hypothetical protein